MNKPLRVLNVEDSERDVALVRRHLSSSGYSLTTDRVETGEQMAAALKAKSWDIILCDYSMPQFNALSALNVLKNTGLDIPLIIISGTVGEDVAVEAMRKGAQDYLMKDNLVRLEPAIERELQESANRLAKRKAENERLALAEIGEASIIAPNLSEFLKLVHKTLGRIVSAENCIVMLHDADAGTFTYEFWADKYDPPPPPKPIGTGFGSYVLRTGKPLRLTRELKKDLIDRGEATLKGTPSLSWIGIPLRTTSRTIGVLVVQHYEVEDAYSERDLEFLSSVGDQIALAIERKRAEEGTRRSEEQLAGIIGSAMDAIISIDGDSRIVLFNLAAEKMFRCTTQKAMGKTIDTFVPDRFRASHQSHIKDFGKTNVTRRSMASMGAIFGLRSDGEEFPIEASISQLESNGQKYYTVILRDITERKNAEQAVSESEERYRDLVENALDIIYTHDLKGNYTSVNKAAETITGYSNEEALAMNIADTVAPEQLEKATRMIAAKLAGDEVTAYELELIAKDGHRVTVEVNTRIIYENGVAVGVQGIGRDITERKQADNVLRQQAKIFDQSFDAVIVWEWNGPIIFWNAGAEELYGIDRKDAVGRISHELLRTNVEGGVDAIVNRLEADGNFDAELIHSTANGREIVVETRMKLIREDNRKYVIETNRDITERQACRRRFERERNQAPNNYRHRTRMRKASRSRWFYRRDESCGSADDRSGFLCRDRKS